MFSRYTLLDLETISAADCEQWLQPIEQDKRFTDPAKIADDLAKKKAALIDSAALDADLCQIVAVGLQQHTEEEPRAFLIPEEGTEREALDLIWRHVNATTPFVGYGLTWFDAGVLVRRSQLLDVRVPSAIYKQGKYRHDLIVELADYLTLNGMIEQKKGRTLDYHCQRLGIQVADGVSGKDVGELWRSGQHEAVRAHLLADMQRLSALAVRLGVIDRPPVAIGPTDEDRIMAGTF